MRIKIAKNIKMLKQNKKCSSKSNSYLLLKENIQKVMFYWNTESA